MPESSTNSYVDRLKKGLDEERLLADLGRQAVVVEAGDLTSDAGVQAQGDGFGVHCLLRLSDLGS